MRTTVTLDADVEALVRGAMLERGESFKQVVNTAIREGLGSAKRKPAMPFKQPTFHMGARSSISRRRYRSQQSWKMPTR